MSIALASRIRNEMCYIQICIDEYDGGEIRGRIFNAYYREAIFFDSSMDMFRKLDIIFDTFDYPHATMDLRRFPSSTGEHGHRTVRVRLAPGQKLYRHDVMGHVATLRARIMFRQNASWQGSLRWVEEGLEENFASVLELIMLLASIFDEE